MNDATDRATVLTTDAETDDKTVSVTYAELAAARGVSIAAARRLTLRHRWPKRPGNDGQARITVPVAFMETVATTVSPGLDDASIAAVAQATTDAMTVALTDVLRVVPTLEALVASLQGQLNAAEHRAREAEGQIGELREKLETE